MLIFLDLETTGLEHDDRICEVGVIVWDEERVECWAERIKPPRKIRPGASSKHHITNEAVADEPAFGASQSATRLRALNRSEHTLVAHHSAFDLRMLEHEGLVWQGAVVDTLRCARALIEGCERYALQFLRYELRLYRDEQALARHLGVTLGAHSALSDALHVKMLYDYLASMRSDLAALSAQPVVIERFAFGKYKGERIEAIALQEPGYLHWMLENARDLDEDLRYSLERYVRENLR
ncbi:MAG: 3'-5' exonuclease [Campylobacterales bacterium]|nr:3'-5' exonuclease [Campylobacterales bacterium]